MGGSKFARADLKRWEERLAHMESIGYTVNEQCYQYVVQKIQLYQSIVNLIDKNVLKQPKTPHTTSIIDVGLRQIDRKV